MTTGTAKLFFEVTEMKNKKLILKNELINLIKSLELRSESRLFQNVKCLVKSKNNHPKLNPSTVKAITQLYT